MQFYILIVFDNMFIVELTEECDSGLVFDLFELLEGGTFLLGSS